MSWSPVGAPVFFSGDEPCQGPKMTLIAFLSDLTPRKDPRQIFDQF